MHSNAIPYNPRTVDQQLTIILKTHAYTSKRTRAEARAGVGALLPVRAPSVEEHLSHAPAQLRTHARTTRTRNETETDFPIGVSCVDYFPQSPICGILFKLYYYCRMFFYFV